MSFSKRSRRRRDSNEAKLTKAAIRYGSTMLAANVEEAVFYGHGYVLVFEKVRAETPLDCGEQPQKVH